MEATFGLVLTSIFVVASITWAVKLVNLLWLSPRKLEKLLRKQGLNGNPYRPFLGDLREMMKAMKTDQPSSIQPSDDDAPPRSFTYYHDAITKFGQNSFLWFGPCPKLNVIDPDLIKEVLSKPDEFQMPLPETARIVTSGLVLLEGEKWTERRKIINPAFHMLKLKNMVPAIGLSCSNLVSNLRSMVSSSDEGWCEIDMWPRVQDLAGDIISRTAFGISHEEGTRIFQLQQGKAKLFMQLVKLSFIPGWRYLPTKLNKTVRAMNDEIQSVLRSIIEKRQKAIEIGGSPGDDLLGILMESNSRFVEEGGKKENAGMSVEDVIEECELFYSAGSETAACLLVWTLVLLSKHPEWQAQAREEVIRVFGNSEPSFDGLNQLKTVTMILHEVLRLYPPAPIIVRGSTETVKLGNMTIPAGVHLSLLVGLLHRDPGIWGDDANEFKPERFSEGIGRAAKTQSAFIPFGSGPRICIGQNLVMIEARMAMAMILRSFSFELSPSYVHAPFAILTLQPQYGAPIIFRSLRP